MAAIAFVNALTQADRRANERRAPAPEVIAAIRTAPQPLTWCERLEAPRRTKLFFDYEEYHAAPRDAQYLANSRLLMELEVREVLTLMGAPTPRIVFATRHGWDPKKGKHKASFRAFVTNYAVPDYTQIRTAVKALKRDGVLRDADGLDDGVYKAGEQLLGCVLCCKGANGDARVLTPEDPDEPLESFFVQHLSGEEVVLEWREPERVERVDASRNTNANPHEVTAVLAMIPCRGYTDWVARAMNVKAALGDADSFRIWHA